MRVNTRLAGPWLELRGILRLEARHADASLLRASARLSGVSRLAWHVQWPTCLLRADVFLDDDGFAQRVAMASGALADAAHELRAGDVEGVGCAPPREPLPVTEVRRLCIEANWSLAEGSAEPSVRLGGEDGGMAAVVPVTQGWRMAAAVDDVSPLPEIGRTAAATFALGLASTVRLTGAALRTVGGRDTLELSSVVTPLTAAGLDRAASALSLACRVYRKASPAFRDADASAHYVTSTELARARCARHIEEINPWMHPL